MLFGAFAGFVLLTLVTFVLLVRMGGDVVDARERPRGLLSYGETIRFFAREKAVRYAVAALSLKVTVSRGIIVALPLYIQRDMGLGFAALAFLVVPGVAGAAAGLLWCGRTVTLDRALSTMRWSIAALAAAVFALAALDYGVTAVAVYSQVPPITRLEASMNTTFAVAIPVAFLLGAGMSGALVSARVALTETAPASQQARVSAAEGLITEAIIVIPMLLLGIGTDFAGARTTLAAMGALSVGVIVLLELPFVLRKVRALPERVSRLRGAVARI